MMLEATREQISAEDRATIVELHAAWKANIIQVAKWGWFWYTLVSFGSLLPLFFGPAIKDAQLKLALAIGIVAAWLLAGRGMLQTLPLIESAPADGHMRPFAQEPVSNVARRAQGSFKLSRFPALSGMTLVVPAAIMLSVFDVSELTFLAPIFTGVGLVWPSIKLDLVRATRPMDPPNVGGHQ